jgi:hypothetical protein
MPSSIPLPVFAPTAILCLALAVFAVSAAVLGAVYLRRLYADGKAATTWLEFYAGPGALQTSWLAAGMLVAALGGIAGPWGEEATSGATVIPWQADASKQPAFMTDYVDVSRYQYIGVLSRVEAPNDGTASIVIYGIDQGGNAGVVRRLPTHAGDWSLWQARNSLHRVRIGVDRPDGAGTVATKVGITLVLQQSPPLSLNDLVNSRSAAPKK